MSQIKIDTVLRNKLRTKVGYLKKHGDDKNEHLSQGMIANKIGISPITLKKATTNKKNIEVSEDVYYKLKEWIDLDTK